MREVHRPSDIPSRRCYLIEFFEPYSIHHEGDERSRSAPGHGYPAYTERGTKIRQFVTENETEWRSALCALYVTDKNRADVSALIVEPAQVFSTVQIKVLVSEVAEDRKRDE